MAPQLLVVPGEEVVLWLPGFAALRATYEAEGYYDETADGDPEEQDLYRIEVLDEAPAEHGAEAWESVAVGPMSDLRLFEPELRRFFPAGRWTPSNDELTPVKQYLLALAWLLCQEESLEGRQRLFFASAGWAPTVIADLYQSLPASWRVARETEEHG